MTSEPIARPGALSLGVESSTSAVTWSAVFGGAAVAIAVSLALLVLGSAWGLAAASPWSLAESAVALGAGAAIWLIIMQWVASALGGYLTGRLRTKWVGVHTDEVFFRDTAHGLLMWAVATVFVAGLFTSTAASVIGAGTQAGAAVVSGAAQGAVAAGSASLTQLDPTAYFTDRLLRPETTEESGTGQPSSEVSVPTGTAPSTTSPESPTPRLEPAAVTPATPETEAALTDPRGEIGRLLARNLVAEDFDSGDRSYLVALISQQTGIDQATAEARIDEVVAQAEAATAQAANAADQARQAGAAASFFFFLSLIIGAFIACVAAAYGGRQRDDMEKIAVLPPAATP